MTYRLLVRESSLLCASAQTMRASYAVAGEVHVARVTFVGLGEAVWR